MDLFLVACERQHIISVGFGHLPVNLLLATQGIERHDAATQWLKPAPPPRSVQRPITRMSIKSWSWVRLPQGSGSPPQWATRLCEGGDGVEKCDVVFVYIVSATSWCESQPEVMLEQISRIQQMARAKLCRMRQAPSGDYYNHQTWAKGCNVIRYVARYQVDDLKKSLPGIIHSSN